MNKKTNKKMGFDIDDMRAKILLAADPNSGYTMEDFNKEFSTNSTGIGEFGVRLGIANKSSNEYPEFATDGSSGFDLRANLESPIKIAVGNRAIVPTGLFFEIPQGLEIQVRPRSGLAAKNGVTVLNTPGTIDADYRGEVKVILINLGEEDFVIQHGDRIAQGVLAAVVGKPYVKWDKVSEVSTDTSRGSGGFGSTGTK
jgi:dUTP pyrophosphatase